MPIVAIWISADQEGTLLLPDVFGSQPTGGVRPSPDSDGRREIVSGWGWPMSCKLDLAGNDGQPMQVAVYSQCDTVRLELNGRRLPPPN